MSSFQIFEWCKFVKMTGLIKDELPFESPPVEEDCEDGTSNENPVGISFELSNEVLKQMEDTYKTEIPEFQSLTRMYNMEREIARRDRRLRNFPKSLSQWQPEGGQLDPHCEVLLNAIHSGPQTTAVVFPQHLKDTKQHSRDLLYVSRHHPTKRPSVVFFHHPSSGKLKFGEVENIYKHSYALKEYMWATLNLFDGEQFDSRSGLWWSENSMGQKMPVLLCQVSHPLTIANEDSSVWFLDVFAC